MYYHPHQRQTHEYFIAQQLGCGPDAAQQRVFALRGPSAQYHAVNAQRRHRQKKEQTDVEIHHLDNRGVGNDGKDHQHSDHHHGRRQHKHGFIGKGRNPISL